MVQALGFIRGVNLKSQISNLKSICSEISTSIDADFDKRISKVVQAPGFLRGINPKPQIENPQAPAFIRGVASKI